MKFLSNKRIVDTADLLDTYLKNIDICEDYFLSTGTYVECRIFLSEEGGILKYYAEEDRGNNTEGSE